MPSRPKRDLIKGSLKPPRPNPTNQCYTQRPASRDEISVRGGKDKDILVQEFSSDAVPQPFLDPSIMQRRIEADKQRRAEQEKTQTQASSSSQGA